MFSVKYMKNTSYLLNRRLNSNNILNHLKYLTFFSYIKNKPNFNQNLVIDLSFEHLMTTEECHRLAIDLHSIHTINSSFSEERQFNVSLFPSSKDSTIIAFLCNYLPKLETLDNFDIRLEFESYLNSFENQRLVYLTPDARDVIQFDSNDIYIIGGIVQKKIFKRKSTRITYSKAKREGLRFGRLPIDHLANKHMKRGIVLFLPQVFNLLIDVKYGESWETTARNNIPDWKLRPPINDQYPKVHN